MPLYWHSITPLYAHAWKGLTYLKPGRWESRFLVTSMVKIKEFARRAVHAPASLPVVHAPITIPCILHSSVTNPCCACACLPGEEGRRRPEGGGQDGGQARGGDQEDGRPAQNGAASRGQARQVDAKLSQRRRYVTACAYAAGVGSHSHTQRQQQQTTCSKQQCCVVLWWNGLQSHRIHARFSRSGGEGLGFLVQY